MPADDAYEAGSLLETELLEALSLLEQCRQGSATLPVSSGSNGTYAADTSMVYPDPGLHGKIQP